MDALTKQARETQLVLGGTLLFLILSFFGWQSFDSVSVGGLDFEVGGGSFTMWHGLGVLAGLLAIALLIWEIVRVLDVKLDLAGVAPGLVSVVLAIALAVITVIKFLQANEGRSWPAWVGLVLAIVVAVAAWKRGQDEGVQMPAMPSSAGSSGTAASTASTPPPAAPAPAEPAAPTTPPADEPRP